MSAEPSGSPTCASQIILALTAIGALGTGICGIGTRTRRSPRSSSCPELMVGSIDTRASKSTLETSPAAYGLLSLSLKRPPSAGSLSSVPMVPVEPLHVSPCPKKVTCQSVVFRFTREPSSKILKS